MYIHVCIIYVYIICIYVYMYNMYICIYVYIYNMYICLRELTLIKWEHIDNFFDRKNFSFCPKILLI